MSDLRIVGSMGKLRKRTEAQARQTLWDGSLIRPGVSPSFKGNAKAALTITPTDRTLGASPRQGWRLSGEAGKNARHSTSGYVAVSEPLAYVSRPSNKRVAETDRL